MSKEVSLWRGAVMALVCHLMLSGPGWAEEGTANDLERQRRQLHGLIGVWKFHVDMSPTYPSYPDTVLDFQYSIYSVGQALSDKVVMLAFGADRGDSSQFVVQAKQRTITGQVHNFSMSDEDYDKESGKKVCFHYTFNQVGRYVLGYAKMTREAEKDYCTDVVGVGIVTGVRQEEALKD